MKSTRSTAMPRHVLPTAFSACAARDPVSPSSLPAPQSTVTNGVPKLLDHLSDAIQSMTDGINELNSALGLSSGVIDESLFTKVVNTVEDQSKACEDYLLRLSATHSFVNGLPVEATERFPRPKATPGDYFVTASQTLFDILNSQYLTLNNTIKEANDEYSHSNNLEAFQMKVQSCYRNYIQMVSAYLGGVRESLRLADSFRSSYLLGYNQISNLVNVSAARLHSVIYVRPILEQLQEKPHDQFVQVLDDCHLSCYHPTVKFSRELSVEDVIAPESTPEEVYAHFSPLMSVVRQQGNVVLLAHGQSQSGKSHCLFGPDFKDGVATRLIQDMIFSVQEKEANARVYLRFFEIGPDSFQDLYTGSAVRRCEDVHQVSVRSLAEVQHFYERFLVGRTSGRSLVVQSTLYTNTMPRGQVTILELQGSEKLRGLTPTEGFLPSLHRLLLGEKVDRTPLYSLLSQCLEDPQSVLCLLVTLGPALASSEETQVNAQFASLLRPGRANPLLRCSTESTQNLRQLKNKFFETLQSQFASSVEYQLVFDQNNVLKQAMDSCLSDVESFGEREHQNSSAVADIEVEITNYRELIDSMIEKENSLQQSIQEALQTAKSANDVYWKKHMNSNRLEAELELERARMEAEAEEAKVRDLRAKVSELKRKLQKSEETA